MIKKILSLSFVVLFISVVAHAQLNPVSWAFNSKKIGDKKYEVRLIATMQPGWHLYSQLQPKDAIAIPTDIQFNNNPLIKFDGKTRELGKMEKYNDAKLGLSANQYARKVEFVQTVTLKANAKTNLSGTIEYQTCDDVKCLPPKKVNFSLAIQ